MPIVIHRENGAVDVIDSDVGGGKGASAPALPEWDVYWGLKETRVQRARAAAAERDRRRRAGELEGDDTEGLRADQDGLRR